MSYKNYNEFPKDKLRSYVYDLLFEGIQYDYSIDIKEIEVKDDFNLEIKIGLWAKSADLENSHYKFKENANKMAKEIIEEMFKYPRAIYCHCQNNDRNCKQCFPYQVKNEKL